MEKKTYSKKLLDPRWQKKRLEILDRDEWMCKRCFDSGSTLHVHHLRYCPVWEPWEYPNHLLMTLCEECHNIEYEMMPTEIDSLIDQIKEKGFFSSDIQMIASGFNGLNSKYPPDVTASAIEFLFRNDYLFDELMGLYFEHIKQENEKRRGDKNES